MRSPLRVCFDASLLIPYLLGYKIDLLFTQFRGGPLNWEVVGFETGIESCENLIIKIKLN